MIQSLKIVNFVLIDELEIFFHEGMHVLSGETGAGKSIVVDAVNLVLGSRADRGMIRTGFDKSSVEAVFDTRNRKEIADILNREEIEYDGQTVTVYRELAQSGRNLCRVCGVIVPLSLLKELGQQLIDIHGQHEHQFLMDPEMHLGFLDRMGTGDYSDQLRDTAEACAAFLDAHRRYLRLRKEKDQKQRRMEELEKNLRELHEAKLKPGEEEALEKECLRLRNSEKITSVLRTARDAITAGEAGSSSLERIRQAFATLQGLEKLDESAGNLSRRCESAYYELEEIAYEVADLIDKSDSDPARLEKAEARLDLIRRLKRRYGASLTDVLEEMNRQEKEYENLCSLEDTLVEAGRSHKQLLARYRHASKILSEKRKTLAADFETHMMDQLRDLGMDKTLFRVSFEPEEEKKPMPRPCGDDRIEFLISPNPGEPLRPLEKIASGGELSRFMLALKTLESRGNGVDCMVFDEIDTGISGRMAQAVAEKMISISGSRQVICVTHLPQIAAAADHHFLVEKVTDQDRTHTLIRELDLVQRVGEVARMISGAEGISSDAQSYAKTMIDACVRRKIVNK